MMIRNMRYDDTKQYHDDSSLAHSLRVYTSIVVNARCGTHTPFQGGVILTNCLYEILIQRYGIEIRDDV